MSNLEYGTDQQYLESWLQFNVAYRAQVALACHLASTSRGGSTGAAAALEAFQQYLFVLEDLATWASAIPTWLNGEPLVDAVETANANWRIYAELRQTDERGLAHLFHLPNPDDAHDEGARDEYLQRLKAWTGIARAVSELATTEAQNGGQLANRLQNKMKHGLHFAAAVDDVSPVVHFYAHRAGVVEKAELPAIRMTPQSSERWMRRCYDVSRLQAALLRTLFVSRFVRDPLAWRPRAEPSDALTVYEIETDLAAAQLPRLQWQ